MSLVKKLIGETAIYGLSSILSRLINYVVMTPYLTSQFTPAEYGVVSEMYAYVALLMVFFTYRMETAFFRFASKTKDIHRVFSTVSIALLSSTVVLTISLVVLSPYLGRWLDSSNYDNYIVWFAFVLALDTLAAIPFAKLRLDNKPIKFAVLKTVNILVTILSLFFFLELCPYLMEKGWAISWFNDADRIQYVFIANFMGSLVIFLSLLGDYKKLQWVFDKQLFRNMLSYAIPLIIVGIAAVVNQQLNIPLLKPLLNQSEAITKQQIGEFSACAKVAILMSLAIQAFNYAAEPFFFRNANREDAPIIYGRVGQMFALAGSLIFLGIMMYLDIFKHIIPSTYWAGLGIIPILLLAYFFLGLYYNFSIWYKLSDKTIFGAYISIGGAVFTLIANILLVPRIGYYGAAWAALGCYGLMTIASYLTGQRHYPIPYPITKMLSYIGLAILFYLANLYLHQYIELALLPKLGLNTVWFGMFMVTIYVWDGKNIRAIL